MGLPSDSESNHSPNSDSEESEEEEEGPPTANTSQVSVPTPALHRTQSTTSVVSQLSAPESTAKADELEDKLSKFDERFKTATSTNEEVLSMFFFLSQCFGLES